MSISRRDVLKQITATAALAGCGKNIGVQSQDRPNIIYIMVDDMGIGDLGCYGQELIKTPNIDKLAEGGMRFTDAYSGSAVCAPTRCSLMTGLHTGHCTRRDNTAKGGWPDNTKPLVSLRSDDFTLASMLQQAGYVTGGTGKWGLGNPGTTGTPDKHGFDHFYGYLDQVHAHQYYTDWLWHDGEHEHLPGNADGRTSEYSHDLMANWALDFVRQNADRPFFLYVPWTIPHGKYEVPSIAPYINEDWSDVEKIYAAMITRMDGDVGRLMALLKELNIDDNTIVFFTSDNGPVPQFIPRFKSSLGMRGWKRALYEGGTRAPMIVRWPDKIQAGAVSNFTWTHIDFMSTAAELAGIAPPSNTDGMSVLPTLLGRQQAPHEFLYWEIHSTFQQAVRMGDWKGHRYGTEAPLQLYNLKSDFGEQNDVSADNPAVVRKIEEIMKAERVDSPYFPAVAQVDQARIDREGW
jgi:arylsulfatase A-like enzyme